MLPSITYDINNRGEIVGALVQGSIREAFIWLPQDERMFRLRDYVDDLDPRAVLLSATAINEKGWISGYGAFPDGDGYEDAFVLIPRP